ncbi:MAG: flagellar hook-length control protein FliK [Desulfovibrio sp.]|jgi:flagellar hook-length control protein FliK|nr:flagellar hook-length control protein FliK [Desulfovibrio sp.]
MQFLPTGTASFFTARDKAPAGREALPRALDAAGGNARLAPDALAGEHESAAAEYQRLFREALAAMDGGEEVSTAAALRDTAGPLARGPYSRHTTDGVTYSLDEVCFTKKELLELRRELLKAGAPEQALKQFDALAGQPDGAMLAQVMASLQQMTAPRQLDKTDKDNIVELLGRIDPTGDLAQEAVALMEEGRGQAALTLISQTFSAVESGGVEMRKDQLLSLGRGLGLDATALQRIANTMGDYAAGLFSSAQFNALTAPAQEQFAAENARQSKVNTALEATLKPAIARARARMEKEKSASSLQERKVEQSKTHIEKTVLQKSRRRLDIVLQEGQSGHDDAAAETAHSDAVGQRRAEDRSDAVSRDRDAADKTTPRDRGNKSAAAAPAAERAGMPLTGTGGKNALSGLRNADIVSARLYRDAPSANGAQAPQTGPQAPSAQAWLAERLLAQRQRPSETAPPELHFEKRPGSRLGASDDARPAARTTEKPETAAARHTDAAARAADAARAAAVEIAAGDSAGTRAAVSRPVVPTAAKADDAASGQLGAARATAAQPAAAIAEKPESATARQTDAARFAAAPSVNATHFVEAGSGGQPAGDDSAGRRGNGKRPAAPATPPEERNARTVFPQTASIAATARPASATRTVEAGGDSRPADDKPDNQRRPGGTPAERQNVTPASTGAGTNAQPAAAPHIAVTPTPVFETPLTPKNDSSAASGHAARQVEESLYSALRGEVAGTTRLDIRLHPQELGAISVALTLHNGEVRACIRSEKDETADLLSRQAETIRASLEQQGVKVDRIEVQLHNPSDSDGGDDGGHRQTPDQRDARQEKDSLRDEFTLLHALANIRNSFMNAENEILEQPVHYHGQTARYADRALHLVA